VTAVNVAVAVYVPVGIAGLGLVGTDTLNCIVDVDPETSVASVVLISSVAAAAVLEAPLQQPLTTNVEPAPVPQAVDPSPVNTSDTSAVFDAFTVNPNWPLAMPEVVKPNG